MGLIVRPFIIGCGGVRRGRRIGLPIVRARRMVFRELRVSRRAQVPEVLIVSRLPSPSPRYRARRASVSRDKVNSARKVWYTYLRVEELAPVTSAWGFMHYAGRGFFEFREF